MFDVEHMLRAGGLAVLASVVFAESGLLVGFFLPGDTLLFVAGFLTSAAGGSVLPPIPVTAAVVFAAAAAGDQVGYLIGRRMGPALFSRPQSRLFNPTRVDRARVFFGRRGPRAIVAARFVPVVRTFAPVVAGVAHMRYRTFIVFNLTGALVWGVGVVSLGAWLGEVPVIKDNLDVAAVAILVISLVPVSVEFLRHRRNRDGLAGSGPL